MDVIRESPRPPTSFWVIAGIGLLWNLMGLAAFVMDMMITPEALAQMPEAMQTFRDAIPSWNWVAYGAATIGGTLGALGLVLRKSWAVPLFAISIVGVILQNVASFLVADGLAALGAGAVILPLVVLAIAVGLLLYARSARAKGWIS